MTVTKYLVPFNEEPDDCPKCGSYDITADNEVDDHGSCLECNDCSFEWVVHYKFVRWSPLG